MDKGWYPKLDFHATLCRSWIRVFFSNFWNTKPHAALGHKYIQKTLIFGYLPDLSLVAATLRREVTDSSHGFTRPRWGGGARAPIQQWCRFRGLSHRCLTLCSTVSHPYGRTSGVRPFTSSRATSCAWCAPTERVHLYLENSFITCCPTFLPLSYIALFSFCFSSSFFY